MEQDRRDVFKKIWHARRKRACGHRRFEARQSLQGERAAQPAPRPLGPHVPAAPRRSHLQIRDFGRRVRRHTGNQDANPHFFPPYTYSPTMGTYTRTGPNSYRLRERGWAMDASGAPAGSSDFTGTAVVASDGKSWSGSGTYIQYDIKGNVVLSQPLTYTAVKFPASAAGR